MPNARSVVKQADLTRVLKSFKDAGLPAPQIVIERDKITIRPISEPGTDSAANPWDQP